jgi:hypothetical protein
MSTGTEEPKLPQTNGLMRSRKELLELHKLVTAQYEGWDLDDSQTRDTFGLERGPIFQA